MESGTSSPSGSCADRAVTARARELPNGADASQRALGRGCDARVALVSFDEDCRQFGVGGARTRTYPVGHLIARDAREGLG